MLTHTKANVKLFFRAYVLPSFVPAMLGSADNFSRSKTEDTRCAKRESRPGGLSYRNASRPGGLSYRDASRPEVSPTGRHCALFCSSGAPAPETGSRSGDLDLQNQRGVMHGEGQALALRQQKPFFPRIAGACPPRYVVDRSWPVARGPVPRDRWVARGMARDRPSPYDERERFFLSPARL